MSVSRNEANMLVRKNILVVNVLLAATTFLVFIRVIEFSFINFDDDLYVSANESIRNGITVEAVRWAFTTGHAGNWHPLTWMSHMLDIELFGLNPHMHHLINLVLHVTNGSLLFFTFFRMTKALWKSVFIAALFAIHPLHVESVAWISERKDVLATLLWLLTMLAYIHYSERPSLQRYLPVPVLFFLGLTAKPMLVTLPCVLLLLDYWPLNRFSFRDNTIEIDRKTKRPVNTEVLSTSIFQQRPPRALLFEKVPLVVLSAITSVITVYVQKGESLVVSSEMLPLRDRIANTFVAYTSYLAKAFWPNDLAFYYPYQWWSTSQAVGSALIFCLVTAAVIWAAKSFRYLIVGWLWFVGTLVPVIGLVQVGSQSMADRYTYVPLIGIFVMVAWGVPNLLKERGHSIKILWVASLVTLTCLAMVTWKQVRYWQNSLTLFDRSLNATNKNYIAYKHRGDAYLALGKNPEAVQDYDKAIAIVPSYYGLAYVGRGIANYRLSNYEKAISDFDSAEKILAADAEASFYRGASNSAIKRYAQAEADFDNVVRLAPSAEAYYQRGKIRTSLKKYKLAIADYDKAAKLRPGNARIYVERALTYFASGKYAQTVADSDRALEVDWRSSSAYVARGMAHAALGSAQTSVEDFGRAIALDPNRSEAYYARAYSYNALGDVDRAIGDLKAAAKLGNLQAQAALDSQGIK